ncbi:MAG: glycosyltransferase family 2 protein [Chloroflexi bacterium]|nr:glycosyltransferase family 2 protein [Chloroflexota bacterium]
MAAELFISVIIATYNRRHNVMRVLDHLSRQTAAAQEFEVIVVDGGSNDGTTAAVQARIGQAPFQLKAFRQGGPEGSGTDLSTQKRQHASAGEKLLPTDAFGPGSNRNLGLRHATGQVVVFLNDDVFVTPEFITAHATLHRKYPQPQIGGLGHVEQDPAIKTTPFMAWWAPFPYWMAQEIARKAESSQHSAEYSQHKSPGLEYVRLDYTFCWTMNLSLKKSFLLDMGAFSEVPFGAHEDIEIGYRLQRGGLELFYLPDALGYHHHPTTFAAECQRQYLLGRGLPFLMQRVPDPRIYRWYPLPNPMVSKSSPEWLRGQARDVARCLLLNDATVPRVLRPAIEWLEQRPHWSRLARLLYWKAMTYYFRKGYESALRDGKTIKTASPAIAGSPAQIGEDSLELSTLNRSKG